MGGWEVILTQRLPGPTIRVSDLVGLSQCLRICISARSLGDAPASLGPGVENGASRPQLCIRSTVRVSSKYSSQSPSQPTWVRIHRTSGFKDSTSGGTSGLKMLLCAS